MKILKYYIFLFISLFIVFPAGASNPVTITKSYDLMSAPTSNTTIWSNEHGNTGSGDHWNVWLCYSNSSSVTGGCPSTVDRTPSEGGTTAITLTFTEKRSGMKQVLNLTGQKTTTVDGSSCSWHYTRIEDVGVNYYCYSAQYNTARLSIYINGGELSKLPVGGIWQATLKLKYTDSYGNFIRDYIANITLNVTDADHAEIYLPAYAESAPLVELDLHPRGAPDGNAYAQDKTTLDMCLYDGYNANSTQYSVTLFDEGKAAVGRSSSDFSIYRVGGEVGPETDRVDYHVQMKSPAAGGGLIQVDNGESIILSNINQSLVRPVRLPKMRYPVLCVPTPLILSVDKFDVKNKSAGFYKGILTVHFNPTTSSVN